MSEDYYKSLGISRSATDAEIQKAYRDLARKFHPDLNPNDKQAKEKFQAVQRAYEVLSDKEKRELYDRYGSAFESMGTGRQAGGWQTGPGGFSADDIDLSQIFGDQAAGGNPFTDLFRQFSQGAGRPRQAARSRGRTKGRTLRHEIRVPFSTAVTGGQAQLTLQRRTGKVETITVKIPAGMESGKTIRLRGQGEPSPNGGPAGDVLLTIQVAVHPVFQRRGQNLEVKVPISLTEAVAGGTIDVPTPYGTISLKVPARTSSGKRLRIKGHGVSQPDGPRGDLYAELQIVLPDSLPDTVVDKLRQWDLGPKNPRAGLKW